MFKHMLYHIVAELVFRQRMDFCQNLVQNRTRVVLRPVFQHALDHSAAVGVHTQLTCVVNNRQNNEFNLVARHLLYAFLNNMVAILVIDALYDVVFEL